MEKKDFLDQFTDEAKANGSKPSSFKEEEMTKVVKDKKPIDPKWFIIPLAAIVVIGIAVYFIFLKPSIIMQNFVGFTTKDVTDFVRQQGIDANGVVFKEEYSLEFDQDQIISQDVPEGTKIGKNAKLTFVVSKGADPDEHVDFPLNLKDMTKDQIEEWISINKLSKTRITTVYDSVIEEGKVISYDLKNTDPKDFKRGSILQIKVSKGPQPPTQVAVEDFKGKDYSSAETWAKSKKLIIAKKEDFSDSLAAGLIISQSAAAGSTIDEGSTFTVTVSLGKGIIIPDFSNMTNAQVDKWISDNEGIVTVKTKYSDSGKYICEQSVESGTKISSTDKITLTKSLGNWYSFTEEFGASSPVNQNINNMIDKANELKAKGINATFTKSSGSLWSSDKSAGTIISVTDTKGKAISNFEHLGINTGFIATCSKGLRIEFDDSTFDKQEATYTTYDTNKVVDALSAKGIPFVLKTSDARCLLEWKTEEPQEEGKHIWYENKTTITIKKVPE